MRAAGSPLFGCAGLVLAQRGKRLLIARAAVNRRGFVI